MALARAPRYLLFADNAPPFSNFRVGLSHTIRPKHVCPFVTPLSLSFRHSVMLTLLRATERFDSYAPSGLADTGG